jgi:hypothetical protein
MIKSSAFLGSLCGLLAVSTASSAGAIAPDPSLLAPYTCVLSQALDYPDATYGEIHGRVYRPVVGKCLPAASPPAGRPVVLFFNGAGYGSGDYDYLAEHLAANGHVVVVVDANEPSPTVACNGGGLQTATCIEDRARVGVIFLRNLQSSWTWAAQTDFLTVTVGGHSRGGEAAVEAARLIWDEEDTLGNPGVLAVFALAPSDEGDSVAFRRRLLGRHSSAFLVLYGSRDEQIIGYDQLEQFHFYPPKTGFALYDRAGREGSLENFPISFDDQVDRSFQFIERANHEQFSDRCGTPVACYPAVLSCDLQHRATLGYVNALLLWKVGGQSAYRAYLDATFDSAWTPAWPQWSDGEWGSRRVIDNFQDGELATATIGGAVSSNGNLVSTVVDNFGTDFHVPHGSEDGRRLHVAVGAASASNILQWTIPANRSNVSGFTHLSVRLGQDFSAVGTARVRFRILRGGSWSPLLTSDVYGTLPDPSSTFTECANPDGVWLEHGLAPLRTFRIPLSAFGGDLTSVTKVQIRFDDATTANEELYLDNLEFAGGS